MVFFECVPFEYTLGRVEESTAAAGKFQTLLKYDSGVGGAMLGIKENSEEKWGATRAQRVYMLGVLRKLQRTWSQLPED